MNTNREREREREKKRRLTAQGTGRKIIEYKPVFFFQSQNKFLKTNIKKKCYQSKTHKKKRENP